MSDDTDATPLPAQPEQPQTAQADWRTINTQGGDYAEGTIDRRQGTFVEIAAEYAYTVAGLPNPYLGLRAFSAAERAIFGGRERIVRALVDRLSADDGDRLLLIAGASGSGKSSLARAGLLPALADQLRALNYTPQTHVIDHIGRQPGTALARLLSDIQRAADRSAATVPLILIDQFEELFSQAAPAEREQALGLLADLAAKAEQPIRMIATMRSDFLPHLLADPRFEAVEQRKIVLRAMTEDELQDAIQRPIQVRHPEKRIEPALVEQLASDAAGDPAYLPLLQVTLEDLWRGGELRRGAYHGLADAIQRRANTVYSFRDYDGLQEHPRKPNEQAAILELFLALVRVSLNEGQAGVRWRRPRSELTQGDPQRESLIADLVKARLLRTDQELVEDHGRERAVETVDIVHEALLSGWKALSDAIEQAHDLLRSRVRFDLAVAEWIANQQHEDYLLVGVRLAEAEALLQQGDGRLLRDDAQAFISRSVAAREQQQQRELLLIQARADAEQQARHEAERRAEEEQARAAAEESARVAAEQRLNVERRLRRRDRVLIALLSAVIVLGAARFGYLEWLRLSARYSVVTIGIPQSVVVYEQYEVTNQRFALCVRSGTCIAPPKLVNTRYYSAGLERDQYPVTGVDGFQAALFCNWVGRRLPTLAEWQQAITPRASWPAQAYPELLRQSKLLGAGSAGLGSPDPVGMLGRSTPDGIYDLIGNVWELTATGWTDDDNQGAAWDGDSAQAPVRLVAKGAGYKDTETAVTKIQRPHTSDRLSDIGFRCVEDR